jgi:DNA replication protein DnaC
MAEAMNLVVLPESEFECKKHGKYRGSANQWFSFWGGKDFVIAPECPFCKEEDRRMHEQRAESVEELELRYAGMNIGEIFWGSTFKNFDAYTPELVKHLETAKKFAACPEGKLVMLGENGNGKNHLAASILKTTRGLIYRAYEIGLILRQIINGSAEETEYGFLKRLCETPVLVIDEVEKLKDSEAKNHWLSYVVGKRYDAMMPIIFISNCHTQDDCKAEKKPCPKCIEYHLENDVLSRIIEDGKIMKFTGEDYRYKKRTERAGGKNA